MGMQRVFATFTLTLLMLPVATANGFAQVEEGPAVRGLFFYSPSCGHCHEVINNHLPGIFDQYGGVPEVRYDESELDPAFVLLTNETLELLMINIDIPIGSEMYAAATIEYGIPAEQQGVPRLVMGDEFYVGSVAIPAALPVLIDEGLAAGGTDWPPLAGLDEALDDIAAFQEAATTTTTAITPPATTETTVPPATTETTTTTIGPFPDVGGTPADADGLAERLDTIGEKFRNDLAGNTLAVIVLAGMLLSLALVWLWARQGRLGSMPGWLVPVLAAAGVVVATYLAYVETSGTAAVCGPVGNCNAVQESKFALLFGVFHVGLVGLISYVVVIGTWIASRFMKAPWADWAKVALALGAAIGVAFSMYLTFLEPFVIGATCIWCLTSAVIVTALLWIAAGPGWAAWRRLRAA